MSNAAVPQAVQSINHGDMLSALSNLDREIDQLEKQFLTGAVQKSEYENRLLILKKRHRESLLELQDLLRNDPKAGQQLRFRLYADRTTQFLLSGFIGGMVTELAPNFDSDRKVRYPVLENIDGSTASINPTKILDELVYAGILGKTLYERLTRCPKCGSHSAVYLRLKCPQCGSLQLESSKLIEHLVCGAVHEFEEFATTDKIRCPSCQEPLVQEGEDFRVVGTFEHCKSCRTHFDDPDKKFACRACQNEFPIKDATYYDTYTYTLNDNALAEVKEVIGFPIYKTAVEEFGFKVDLPGTIAGSSGIIHNFTLAATKNNRTVAIDVAESKEEVDEKELFAFYTKIMDLKPAMGILVAIPRLSNRAKEFATKALGRDDVTFVEAASSAQAIEQLKVKLQQIA